MKPTISHGLKPKSRRRAATASFVSVVCLLPLLLQHLSHREVTLQTVCRRTQRLRRMEMASTAPIVRKKRNFKALQLDVTKSSQPSPSPAPIIPPVQVQPQPMSSTTTEPVATRKPPQANGKRRPANLKLAPKKKPDLALAAPNPTNGEGDALNVAHTPNSAPVSGNPSSSRPGLHNDLTQKLANMDMNSETKLDLRNEDLKELQELGQGNGGSVKKVEHTPTGTIMAKKVCSILQFPSIRSLLLLLLVHFVSSYP